MWRKGTLTALLVGMQTGATTVEDSMQLPQKIKNGTALSPNDSTSRNLSKENRNTNLKGCVHPYVHCSTIYIIIVKIWNQPKCPSIDEWIKKLWYIYTMEYHLAVKRRISYLL